MTQSTTPIRGDGSRLTPSVEVGRVDPARAGWRGAVHPTEDGRYLRFNEHATPVAVRIRWTDGIKPGVGWYDVDAVIPVSAEAVAHAR